MCDDDINIAVMLSIAHDHDYTVSHSNNSIVYDTEHANNTIDDNIETMLSTDESFGILQYENNFQEVIFKNFDLKKKKNNYLRFYSLNFFRRTIQPITAK